MSGQSNQKKLRKKVAAKLEDEIFTINTDVELLHGKIKQLNFKELHSLSYDHLKSIREEISWIIPRLNNLNNIVNNIEKGHGRIIDLTEENLPKVVIASHRFTALEKEIIKENPDIEGSIIEIVENPKTLGTEIKALGDGK